MDKDYIRYLISLLSDKRPVMRRLYYVLILVFTFYIESALDTVKSNTDHPPPVCAVDKDTVKALLKQYQNGEL